MLADLLKECGAIKLGKFILTSGKESNYYVDIKRASTNPQILWKIAEEMSKYVTEDKIAGMELGAVPIAVALSLKTKIPYLIIRKEERTHGTAKQVEGDLSLGDKVVIVEDVTTTGNSVIKAVGIIRNLGAEVKKALVVVDREEGATELLAKEGVKLISMVNVSILMESQNL